MKDRRCKLSECGKSIAHRHGNATLCVEHSTAAARKRSSRARHQIPKPPPGVRSKLDAIWELRQKREITPQEALWLAVRVGTT